jgi:teichoic acid transport system ATP-binding protein
MPAQSSSSARIFALVALAICAVAVLIVIGSSLGGGDDSSGGGSPSDETTSEQTAGTTTVPARRQPATYTVQSGDTLGAIAETTGVTVETLQELNPELDPQALIAGQKIQLR